MIRFVTTCSFVLAAFLAASACDEEPRSRSNPSPPSPESAQPEEALEPWSDAWILAAGERYLNDPEHRRASMLRALRNHENLYARTRIASYGLGDRGWDRLPEWSPRTRVLARADRDTLEAGGTPELGDATAIGDGTTPRTMAEWVALGRDVFYRYPLRADAWVEHGLRDATRAEARGLAETSDGRVPGAVVFADLDGRARVGITCALCHTRMSDGVAVEGEARRAIDYGKLQLDLAEARGRTLDEAMARRMASWGPGRADITEDDDEDPVAIPDLWGLRHQSALTQAGTIRHVGPVSLALRQETQYLYANHARTRPPRVLMFALVAYLYALEPPPRSDTNVDAEAAARGESIFAERCSDCHSNAAYGGAPVRAARVGTDPALSRGVARGTGLYRPSGLVRVADAAPYFHHGAVATLEDLFTRDRFDETYEGPLGRGAVRGHDYGTDLDPRDRTALLAFLGTL